MIEISNFDMSQVHRFILRFESRDYGKDLPSSEWFARGRFGWPSNSELEVQVKYGNK